MATLKSPAARKLLNACADENENYSFTPRPAVKTKAYHAWERKASTPFAARSENQKIWKRYELPGSDLFKGEIRRGRDSLEKRSVKKMKLSGRDQDEELGTKWDDGTAGDRIHKRRPRESLRQSPKKSKFEVYQEPIAVDSTTFSEGEQDDTESEPEMESDIDAEEEMESEDDDDRLSPTEDAEEMAQEVAKPEPLSDSPASQHEINEDQVYLSVQQEETESEHVEPTISESVETYTAVGGQQMELSPETSADTCPLQSSETQKDQELEVEQEDVAAEMPDQAEISAAQEIQAPEPPSKDTTDSELLDIAENENDAEPPVAPVEEMEQGLEAEVPTESTESLVEVEDAKEESHDMETPAASEGVNEVEEHIDLETPTAPIEDVYETLEECHDVEVPVEPTEEIEEPKENENDMDISPAPTDEIEMQDASSEQVEHDEKDPMESVIVVTEEIQVDVSIAPGNVIEQTSPSEVDEDTALLQSFLSRVKARKAAANAASSIAKLHGVVLTEDNTESVEHMDMPSSVDDTEEAEAETMDIATSPVRRSRRTPASRGAKTTTTITGPNQIPVLRRPNGTEFVFLARTETQEIALATRNNTRRNKGHAVEPKMRIKELAEDETESKSPSPKKRKTKTKADTAKSAKQVSWDEKLAYFEDEDAAPGAKEVEIPEVETSPVTKKQESKPSTRANDSKSKTKSSSSKERKSVRIATPAKATSEEKPTTRRAKRLTNGTPVSRKILADPMDYDVGASKTLRSSSTSDSTTSSSSSSTNSTASSLPVPKMKVLAPVTKTATASQSKLPMATRASSSTSRRKGSAAAAK